MNKEFIQYNIAIELKQLGFDEPCFGYYIELRNPIEGILTIEKCENNKDGCLAPTFSQAFRFFRETYGLKHDIDDDNIGTKFYYKIKSYTDKFDNYDDIIKPMREEKDWAKIEFKTYEEAELACLIKLIEIIKQQDNGK
jgi:hypothetical protein